MFSAIEKVNYYIRDLKPSDREEALEELRRMPPNFRPSLIDIRRNTAAKVDSQQTLLKKYSRDMNTKISEEGLTTFCLVTPRMHHLLDLL